LAAATLFYEYLPTCSISRQSLTRIAKLFSSLKFFICFRRGYMENYATLSQSCHGHALQKVFFRRTVDEG